MKKVKYKIISGLLFLFAAFIIGARVQAYDFIQSTGLNTTAGATGHTQQALFGQQNSIEYGISVILNVVLSFLGVIFLILIIYAGVRWMIAKGNEQKVTQAQDILEDSVIGFIVVASASAISYFILGTFVSSVLNQ